MVIVTHMAIEISAESEKVIYFNLDEAIQLRKELDEAIPKLRNLMIEKTVEELERAKQRLKTLETMV